MSDAWLMSASDIFSQVLLRVILSTYSKFPFSTGITWSLIMNANYGQSKQQMTLATRMVCLFVPAGLEQPVTCRWEGKVRSIKGTDLNWARERKDIIRFYVLKLQGFKYCFGEQMLFCDKPGLNWPFKLLEIFLMNCCSKKLLYLLYSSRMVKYHPVKPLSLYPCSSLFFQISCVYVFWYMVCEPCSHVKVSFNKNIFFLHFTWSLTPLAVSS